MAAHMSMFLVQTVHNIYRYFGLNDSIIDENAVFQEPRSSRNSPNKCDLWFPFILVGGCEAVVPGVLLLPEYKNYKMLVNIEKVKEELPSASEGWVLPVVSCSISQNTLCIFLDHEKAFRNTLYCIFSEKTSSDSTQTFQKRKVIEMTKDPLVDELATANLTQLRTILAFQSLSNVYNSLGYHVKNNSTDDSKSSPLKLHVCYKSLCTERNQEQRLVFCGAVLDIATRMKANNICAGDYYKLKATVFENLAQGRVNCPDSTNQPEMLSEAEVSAELLGVKLHDHVSVTLSKDSGNIGMARGATFLIYNHVRLSCIRKKFEQEVKCGNYPELPAIKDIDFRLLIQNEEWELLFSILQFPYWLINCISPKEKISLHPLIVGLHKMCRIFSVYYRRVRILTEPRPHLLPVMYARIYLLRSLEHILGIGLSIYDMKPLGSM